MLTMLTLSACADMSTHNKQPAPIGQTGKAEYPSIPSSQSYALDDEVEQYHTTADFVEPEIKAPQNPAVVALLDSAYQQSESGQLDIAVAKLERAVRIAPKDGNVWHALANVRQKQGKHALAISLAKKSNVFALNDPELQRKNWLLMARAFETLGNTRSSKQAHEKAKKLF